MAWLKLTPLPNGSPILVNTEHIICIETANNRNAVITFSGHQETLSVVETAENIEKRLNAIHEKMG